MTVSAFTTGVSGIDTTGEDALVPRLVLGVTTNAAFHPESAFAVSLTAIRALLRFELAQVFKNENRRSMLLGKLHNASTDLVGQALIGIPDLAPEGLIVLFALSYGARLGAVACNAS
jgi:hypothetical protein